MQPLKRIELVTATLWIGNPQGQVDPLPRDGHDRVNRDHRRRTWLLRSRPDRTAATGERKTRTDTTQPPECEPFHGQTETSVGVTILSLQKDTIIHRKVKPGETGAEWCEL